MLPCARMGEFLFIVLSRCRVCWLLIEQGKEDPGPIIFGRYKFDQRTRHKCLRFRVYNSK